MQTESELIGKARAGSVPAFTALVARYRDGLLRFLVTRCASFADAEDALQDTLINAYRYLDSYNPAWRFSTWLYRIAIRNAQKMRSDHTVQLADLADDRSGPLEQCIADQAGRNLWVTARRELSDEVFTAMWLRYVEDMSIRDIAQALDRSSSWTKVNLLRGRRTLASAIGETAAAGRGEPGGVEEERNCG